MKTLTFTILLVITGVCTNLPGDDLETQGSLQQAKELGARSPDS